MTLVFGDVRAAEVSLCPSDGGRFCLLIAAETPRRRFTDCVNMAKYFLSFCLLSVKLPLKHFHFIFCLLSSGFYFPSYVYLHVFLCLFWCEALGACTLFYCKALWAAFFCMKGATQIKLSSLLLLLLKNLDAALCTEEQEPSSSLHSDRRQMLLFSLLFFVS